MQLELEMGGQNIFLVLFDSFFFKSLNIHCFELLTEIKIARRS